MSVNKSVTVPVGSSFLSVTLQASQIALACVGAQFLTQRSRNPARREGSLVVVRDIAGAGFEPATFGL